MSERSRKIASAKTSWPVTVKHPKGEMDGLIASVNTNSVLIICSRPLKLNEVCRMTINAPSRSFEAQGEVVWSNIYGRDDEITPRGMRVRFLKISSQDRLFIASELEGQGVKKVAEDYLKTLNTTVDDIKSDAS
jgi:hypothetical protein